MRIPVPLFICAFLLSGGIAADEPMRLFVPASDDSEGYLIAAASADAFVTGSNRTIKIRESLVVHYDQEVGSTLIAELSRDPQYLNSPVDLSAFGYECVMSEIWSVSQSTSLWFVDGSCDFDLGEVYLSIDPTTNRIMVRIRPRRTNGEFTVGFNPIEGLPFGILYEVDQFSWPVHKD